MPEQSEKPNYDISKYLRMIESEVDPEGEEDASKPRDLKFSGGEDASRPPEIHVLTGGG